MVRCIAFLAALSVALPSLASDPVADFENIVLRGSRPPESVNAVVYSSQLKGWAKRDVTLHQVRYDVRKTDSLVTPVIGVANFDVLIRLTRIYPTEAEAKTSMDFDPKLDSVNKVELRYAYRDGRWFYSGGEYRSPNVPARAFELNEDRLRAGAKGTIPAIVTRWLP
jgi:hypothetical protein